MRMIRLAAAASLAAFSGQALAADPAPATPPAATTPAAPPAATPAAPPTMAGPAMAPKTDPVIATVDGQPIHLSEVQEAATQVPEEYRNLPPQVLYPQIVEQLIDRKALLKLAQVRHMDQDPAVQKSMLRAEQQALQNAVIAAEVGPTITPEAVRARYDATIANKPGEEEVHARHILVSSEDEAKKIIADLDKGADFATEAKAHSTDPGAANGGDLGFFKKGDMLPEFSAVAFALKPGEISQTPVHTRYGWHVIKVEGTRTATPPTFDQAKDELRQTMIQEGIQKVVKEARAVVTVQTFNPDGSPTKPPAPLTPPATGASGSATPAPAAAPAPAK
jgi:peptidyl-prolyl cis-trans isomerase C